MRVCPAVSSLCPLTDKVEVVRFPPYLCSDFFCNFAMFIPTLWANGWDGDILESVIDALLPADFDDLQNVTYVEPFVGGGAILFF